MIRCVLKRVLASLAMLPLVTNLAANDQVKNQAIRQAKSKRYTHLGRLIKKNLGKKITSTELKEIAKKAKAKPLLNAIDATRKINKHYKTLGLKKNDLLQTALFIESGAASGYMPTTKTDLAFAIECDPKNKSSFIVLSDKKHFLGSGAHKKVYKAIHYKKSPEVVARGHEKTKEWQEQVLTKKMHGKPGIFKTVGFGKYTRRGDVYRSIYAKLYRPGSLHEVLEKHITLSTYEKLKIAQDMLQGLASLHNAKIVHRDLAARNFLVDIPKGKAKKRLVSAAVADFGHAIYSKYAAKTKVMGNTKYTSPEGLFINKMKGKDYYKSDIFAVGCVFYWLFYGKQPPWFDRSYVKDVPGPAKYRYKLLKGRIEKATKSHRCSLQARKSKLKPKEQFEYLLLKMLHTNPKKRGTAKQLSLRMNMIMEELEKN